MKKFADAFNGLAAAFRHRAVKIQLILGMMAVAGGIIIGLDHHEWLAFIICIMIVVSMEIMNTAVEQIGDYLCGKNDERIRLIKDISSAAVLTASVGALAVCIICVLRRI